MAKYRKISPRIWNDAGFRQLSDKGKLVFFLLLTHPQTSAIGTLRVFVQGLAPEMGWTEQAFREAFGEVLAAGMARASERDGLIWMPNFMKYNAPQSPNALRSWAPALEDCPECGLKNTVRAALEAVVADLGEGFRKAFAQAFGQPRTRPSPNQEQEQEQEQDKETLTLFESLSSPPGEDPDPAAAGTSLPAVPPAAQPEAAVLGEESPELRQAALPAGQARRRDRPPSRAAPEFASSSRSVAGKLADGRDREKP